MEDSQSGNIRIIFMIPSNCKDKSQTSIEMQQAFEACNQNKINVQWLKECDYEDLQYNKTDFIVFQKFEGKCFEDIKKTKSVRIVGPWCLLTCLTDSIQVPNFPWPIYSVAMRDCVVSCSSISKLERAKVQEKIEYMGGRYSPELIINCTHLITDSVISEKYIKAVEAGIEIMLHSWVDEVWDASLKSSIHCNDPSFDMYRCPVFHNLTICCTGLNQIQRIELNRAVTENGGKYSEVLHIKSTDILVCEGTSNSDKYKAAKKHSKIKCVTSNWIKDSIKNKYAMPVNLYSVRNITSTPTKVEFCAQPDFSMISNISTLHATGKDETLEINPSCVTKLGVTQLTNETTGIKRKSNSNECNELVDAIDLKQVKMLGPFLDGCSIYLVGFGLEQREKLCKILNYSSATRYDQISERITHVLVGDASCHEFKLIASKGLLKNCSVVGIQWLLDSIKEIFPVLEESYIVNVAQNTSNELTSPLTKKSLQLLHSDKRESSKERTEKYIASVPAADVEVDIVQQYLLPSMSSQDDTLAKMLREGEFDSKQDTLTLKKSQRSRQLSVKSNNTEDESSDKINEKQSDISRLSKDDSMSSAVDDSSQLLKLIFQGLKFTIDGFLERSDSIKQTIEDLNGKVVSLSFKGVPDYAVVPVFNSKLKAVATEIVNELWLLECYQEMEMIPLTYIHRPVIIQDDAKPLRDSVVTITSYVTYERIFLKEVIIKLGGIYQEQLSKVNKGNILASTHLISPEASGKKYTAAIKWGLFVVSKDWLLECVRTATRVPEEQFPVEDIESNSASEKTPTKNDEGLKQSLAVVSNVSNIDSVVPNASCNIFTRTGSPIPCSSTSTGCKTFGAPINEHLNNSNVGTPINRILKDVQNTSGICSQITPVQSLIAEARKQNLLGTPQNVPRPKSWNHIDTPSTPLGKFIRENPSPNLRKEMARYLDTFPSQKQRRDSTPLSELKRRLWDKIYPTTEMNIPDQPNFELEEHNSPQTSAARPIERNTTPDNTVSNRLEQLQEMLTNSSNNRNSKHRASITPVAGSEVRDTILAKDSQPNTVGWDYMDVEQQPKKVPIFMLSAIDREKREIMEQQLESLGAAVSSLSSFDPLATHLICQKPPRNEKVFACMAAGKWILHMSYVDKCVAKGQLMDEECYEFGNPKFGEDGDIPIDNDTKTRLPAMHYWRKEVARRGYGAFHDTRAIIIAQKKEMLARIIQAGGGIVVNVSPPFTEPVHATICLLDLKYVQDISEYIPLAKQGIYCVNMIYVSEFLQRTTNDVRNHIVPELAQYY